MQEAPIVTRRNMLEPKIHRKENDDYFPKQSWNAGFMHVEIKWMPFKDIYKVPVSNFGPLKMSCFHY